MDFPVIFENDDILLIHKKAGVSVQGGAGITHSLDVELPKFLGYKIFLVHRLDKDTEGILCVAKNPQSAGFYTKLFSSKDSSQIKKEYIALCFGKPVLNGKECEKGTINFPIVKDGRSLPAVTHFKVENSEIKEFAGEETGDIASLVVSKLRVNIDTGRMHQIRIHLSKCGCPIIGDDKHGNFKLNKKAKKYLKIKNLMLSAVKLTLPVDGKLQTFSIEEKF